MSNNAQIRALAQQIMSLTTDVTVQSLAQQIVAAAPDPAPVPVPPPTDIRITFYENDNFQGVKFATDVAVSNFADAAVKFNDRASSALVSGVWEVWTDANYAGQKVVLQPGKYPSMRPFGINDAISSCRPVTVPVPQPSTPADFTYFGGADDEVITDVTMRWLPRWGGLTIVDDFLWTKAAGINKVILELTGLCYSGNPLRYQASTAKNAVRARFKELQDAGVLDMVKVLYPIDEPDVPEADIVQCNADLCMVASEFPELAQVKLAVIYGDHQEWRGLASYVGPGGGLIGIDSYDHGANVLTDIYPQLEASLSANQSLIVVPGGADPWRQDPTPFVEYSKTHRVGLICAFIFDSHWGGTQNRGIVDNGMRPAYAAIAPILKGMV